MSEVRATTASSSAARLNRTATGSSPPVDSTLAPPPADQSPAVNVGGALNGGESRGRIEGVVIGTDDAGLALLRTAAGDFRVETALSLAERSRLVLEVVHLTPVMTAKILIQDGRALDPPPPARLTPFGAATTSDSHPSQLSSAGSAAAPRQRPTVPDLRLAREWPALDEALKLLQGQDTAAPLMAALPGADDRLASSILFYFAALKEANLERWLGTEVRQSLTEAGREDLVNQLAADFSAFAALIRNEGTNAWQTLRFPLHLGSTPEPSGELVPLSLFVRHSAESEGGGIRFVLEIPHPAFGPLQIDGLTRTPPGLDLILRAHLPLPATLQATLVDLAHRIGARLGWSSRLIFETAAQFPVHPLQDIGAGRPVSDLRV